MVELQKDPLGPAIVFRLGGVDLPAPVEGDAQQPHLPLVVGGEAADKLGRVGLQTDGRVFRGQTEGIPTHGMEDVFAPHAVVAAQHVRRDVISAVANAEPVSRRVGKEIQHVPLGAAIGRSGPVKPVPFPAPGPLGLDPVGGVFRGHDSAAAKGPRRSKSFVWFDFQPFHSTAGDVSKGPEEGSSRGQDQGTAKWGCRRDGIVP